MQLIRPMILLVREAPHGQALTGLAEVNGLLDRALRRLAPVTVANPAKIATQVAHHYLDIRAFILVTHTVHLCISVSTAQHYAVDSCDGIEVTPGHDS